MAQVNLDSIPQTRRPDAVEHVYAEAVELRAKLREANEALAGLQAELEDAEARDVQAAAAKIRQGNSPGAISTTIAKTRSAIELQTRQTSALTLASGTAEADLDSVMREHSDAWLAALDAEQQQERERALAALAGFEQALAGLAQAAAAAAWVRSGRADQRWDRPVRMVVAGSIAPSSRRQTANGEPLRRDEVVAFAHELVGETTEAVGASSAEPDARAASLAQAS